MLAPNAYLQPPTAFNAMLTFICSIVPVYPHAQLNTTPTRPVWFANPALEVAMNALITLSVSAVQAIFCGMEVVSIPNLVQPAITPIYNN